MFGAENHRFRPRKLHSSAPIHLGALAGVQAQGKVRFKYGGPLARVSKAQRLVEGAVEQYQMSEQARVMLCGVTRGLFTRGEARLGKVAEVIPGIAQVSVRIARNQSDIK